MTTNRKGQAGSLESCDALVEVELRGDRVECVIDSPVAEMYGAEMRSQVEAVAAELGVSGARVSVTDRGAVNFVLRARVEAALRRALAGGGA